MEKLNQQYPGYMNFAINPQDQRDNDLKLEELLKFEPFVIQPQNKSFYSTPVGECTAALLCKLTLSQLNKLTFYLGVLQKQCSKTLFTFRLNNKVDQHFNQWTQFGEFLT
ncbi:hypothetical protein FGO68_gene12782 [Halteria grandinella]|uniref:Uncharacterized protein n=1 Tax=Halteria grandinella TaxID=5974 RepID=A0A8J8NZK3_HALGN|nr:hypothetical protein FGO68_gene12782 [Halteria grandinella]